MPYFSARTLPSVPIRKSAGSPSQTVAKAHVCSSRLRLRLCLWLYLRLRLRERLLEHLRHHSADQRSRDDRIHKANDIMSRPTNPRAPFAARLYQASARAFAGAGLRASPLPRMSASIFRAREAGTRAFMMRFSRPGTILERFLSRPLRPSDTHCSTLIGFIDMVFGSRPNFSSTAVFVNPAARYSDVDT